MQRTQNKTAAAAAGGKHNFQAGFASVEKVHTSAKKAHDMIATTSAARTPLKVSGHQS